MDREQLIQDIAETEADLEKALADNDSEAIHFFDDQLSDLIQLLDSID